ncbi:Nif11 domain/cupin domain-containing protein [Synechococcus sp. L2F]|uniref:Nif11 domain/cupin domain-containing protein n=1 Tax=Synechococcus sp. L2F TaxID=2823739 RepID=UPI0020CD65AB|nr:Nif11 domain/cupin domain-containing protein [Synechococcus sp. L2F]MCP9827271.1 Nif11 domain/cupin domain-containing protein [Synechococcus sp. L2F]
MAESDLQQFRAKVSQLVAFVALSDADPDVEQALRDCSSHHEVVALARRRGFEIGRRWGEHLAPAAPGADNLLVSTCPLLGEERLDLLIDTPDLRLERIHSCAWSTPAGQWQSQALEEWVLVLRGGARLAFADEPTCRELVAGDTLRIAPGRLHRVEATDPAPGTLWLALHWRSGL